MFAKIVKVLDVGAAGPNTRVMDLIAFPRKPKNLPKKRYKTTSFPNDGIAVKIKRVKHDSCTANLQLYCSTARVEDRQNR